jgi:hypothetical protein
MSDAEQTQEAATSPPPDQQLDQSRRARFDRGEITPGMHREVVAFPGLPVRLWNGPEDPGDGW